MLFRHLDLGPSDHPLAQDRKEVVEVLTSAIRGADAYAAVRRAVKLEEGVLHVGNRFVRRSKLREVAFLAVGNCAGAMARAFHDALGEVVTQGLVGGPEAPPDPWPFLFRKVVEPTLPSPEGAALAAEAIEMAEGLGEKDLFVPLLSPGALGMLASPSAGWGLEDYRSLLERLLRSPSAGTDVPAVAAALSPVQGGGLATAARHVPTEALLVDRGDGARLLGAAPTLPARPEARADARAVLQRARLWDALPSRAREELAPDASQGPGAGPDLHNVIVVSPADALETAGAEAAFRKHRARLLDLHDTRLPEEAAARGLRELEKYAAGRTFAPGEGVGLFSGLSLGLPEGSESRESLARFLAASQAGLHRRGVTIAVLATGGSLRPEVTPSGGMVDARTAFSPADLRPRSVGALDLVPGFTDVGAIAVIYASGPRRSGTSPGS